MEDQLLVPYCKASDLDSLSGTCSELVWGPPPTALPPLSREDGMILCGLCISAWFVGFLIKQARRPVGG